MDVWLSWGFVSIFEGWCRLSFSPPMERELSGQPRLEKKKNFLKKKLNKKKKSLLSSPRNASLSLSVLVV